MMTINVEIGKGIALDVDGEALRKHPNVWDRVVYIGLRNILMDSHASVKREDCDSDADYRDKSRAVAEKKLAAMMDGEMRSNAGVARSFDPVEQAALRMARTFVYSRGRSKQAAEWLAAWSKATGLPFGDEEKNKALMLEAIKRRAANPDVIAAAKAEVEAEQGLKVDTGGL